MNEKWYVEYEMRIVRWAERVNDIMEDEAWARDKVRDMKWKLKEVRWEAWDEGREEVRNVKWEMRDERDNDVRG